MDELEKIRTQTRERVRRYRERQRERCNVTSLENTALQGDKNMDAIYKTYRAEVKAVNEDDGSIELFIPVSTDSVDRDGEVVEPGAFKKTIPKFMKRPVLVASHDYRDLTSQIGEWARLKIGDSGLEGKPKYYVNEGNEQADWGYKLAQKGMAAFSIGFIPKEWEDGDGQKSPRRTYKEVELLEISQVIVPSNREAIQSIRAKSVDPVVTEICDEVEKDLTTNELPIPTETITKPEETDEYIRIPVRDCKVTATIDISEKEGIKALYCGREKKVRTYLFRKDKGWTMEKAQAWVKEHGEKGIEDLLSLGIEVTNPEPNKVSQKELFDELDYLQSLLNDIGLNEDNRHLAEKLAVRILGGEVKMNKGKMQEMHDMMASCESMAKKAKKMSEDMMSDEDMDEEDHKGRLPGNDIPVDEKKDIKPEGVKPVEEKKPEPPSQPTPEEIQGIIGQVKF